MATACFAPGTEPRTEKWVIAGLVGLSTALVAGVALAAIGFGSHAFGRASLSLGITGSVIVPVSLGLGGLGTVILNIKVPHNIAGYK